MTTNTKELLELAALAVGWELDWTAEAMFLNPYNVYLSAFWNPATNSGDSLDLQVKLRISLTYNTDGTWTAYALADDGFVGINCDAADPNMAVLLVAAELGKAMIKEGV